MFEDFFQDGIEAFGHTQVTEIAGMNAVDAGFSVGAEEEISFQIIDIIFSFVVEFLADFPHGVPAFPVVIEFFVEDPAVCFGGVFDEEERGFGFEFSQLFQEIFCAEFDFVQAHVRHGVEDEDCGVEGSEQIGDFEFHSCRAGETEIISRTVQFSSEPCGSAESCVRGVGPVDDGRSVIDDGVFFGSGGNGLEESAVFDSEFGFQESVPAWQIESIGVSSMDGVHVERIIIGIAVFVVCCADPSEGPIVFGVEVEAAEGAVIEISFFHLSGFEFSSDENGWRIRDERDAHARWRKGISPDEVGDGLFCGRGDSVVV